MALVCLAGLAAATVFLPGAPVCLAQSQGTRPVPVQAPGGELINVDFPGGSAAQYIQAVRAASNKSNIVITGNVNAITLPAISLHSVNVLTAVKILDGQTGEESGRNFQVIVAVVDPPGANSNRAVLTELGEPVIMVTVQDFGSPRHSTEATTNVWSLADLIDAGITPDSITTAISTALGLTDGDNAKVPPAAIRFHKETSLLMAYGTKGQLNTIDEVVSRLHETANFRRSQIQAPIQKELEKAQVKLKEAQEVMARREAASSDMDAKMKEFEASNQAIIKGLQAELERTRVQLESAKVQIGILQQQLNRDHQPSEPADTKPAAPASQP